MMALIEKSGDIPGKSWDSNCVCVCSMLKLRRSYWIYRYVALTQIRGAKEEVLLLKWGTKANLAAIGLEQYWKPAQSIWIPVW